LDLNKILLETDSPYLTPEPFRGKINTSLNIPLIAQKIAEIKNEDVDKILEITTKNAISQFDLDA
jgi:TatD DNase family protein